MFQGFVKNEFEQCCRQTISLPNPYTYDKRATYFPIHDYFVLGSFSCHLQKSFYPLGKGKGRAIPLQALTDPEGSRRVRLPDFKTIGT
jgi:hypothetical protein